MKYCGVILAKRSNIYIWIYVKSQSLETKRQQNLIDENKKIGQVLHRFFYIARTHAHKHMLRINCNFNGWKNYGFLNHILLFHACIINVICCSSKCQLAFCWHWWQFSFSILFEILVFIAIWERIFFFSWENNPQFSLLFTAVLIVSIQPYSVTKQKKNIHTKMNQFMRCQPSFSIRHYVHKQKTNYRHCKPTHNTPQNTTHTFKFTLSRSQQLAHRSNPFRMDNELSFLV